MDAESILQKSIETAIDAERTRVLQLIAELRDKNELDACVSGSTSYKMCQAVIAALDELRKKIEDTGSDSSGPK